jgi:NAD(P)-dependent dehydrogenase (short-subunit alcohol dehydrogenase family)
VEREVIVMDNRRRALAAAAAGGVGFALARALLKPSRYSFRHRAVLVTGGSRGLGLELARVFASEGADLAILARDPDELERARQQLEPTTSGVLTIQADVGNRDDVDRAIQRVVDHYGRLDVLVNNAGVIQVGPVAHMQLEDYEEAMRVHFRGPLHTTLAAIPYMRRQHGGRIVNIASIGGKVPVPHLAPYVASKFALVGLSGSLCAELAREQIVITTVSPGLMRTGSPINVEVKGQHEREFAWFAISDAMPVISMDATRAARQIVEACRRGDAEAVLTWPAKLAAGIYGLIPNTYVRLAAVGNRLLPSPTGVAGNRPQLGRDSASRWAPSPLTTLSDRAAARNNELPRPHPVTRASRA